MSLSQPSAYPHVQGVLIHLQHSNQRWFSHYMRFIGIYESFSLNSSISCILGARFIRNMDPLLYVSCFHSQSKRIKFGDNFLMHVAYRGGDGGKMPRTPKSPNNVTSTFFSAVHLLPKDFRFEPRGAKLIFVPASLWPLCATVPDTKIFLYSSFTIGFRCAEVFLLHVVKFLMNVSDVLWLG